MTYKFSGFVVLNDITDTRMNNWFGLLKDGSWCGHRALMVANHAKPQMKKPPEGGFGVSWWPGAESNQGRGW